MAGERTKDITKVNVSITDQNSKKRTLTSLYDYVTDFPELIEERSPDNKGTRHIRKLADNGGNLELTVKAGTQDEKFLDNIASNVLSFDMIIIDESSKEYPKQYTCIECYIKQIPEDSFREIDNRTYSITIAQVKLDQL